MGSFVAHFHAQQVLLHCYRDRYVSNTQELMCTQERKGKNSAGYTYAYRVMSLLTVEEKRKGNK